MELHEEEGDGRERVDWQVFFSFWERERERERDLREFLGFFLGGGGFGGETLSLHLRLRMIEKT